MSCGNYSSLISAYIDGELAPDTAACVAAHLDACEDCRALRDDYAMLGSDLRRSAGQPASPALRSRIVSALAAEEARTSDSVATPSRLRTGPSAWHSIAATLVLCATSSAATYVVTSRVDRAPSMAAELVSAHSRALLQDNPLQVASSDSHTVRPWFAGKVEVAPGVKDLSAQGYPLLGGRLDLVAGRRVAVAVYKRNRHWINVYMWPAGDSAPITEGLVTRAGYNLLGWTRDGVVYCAVSDLNAAELRQLAQWLS